MASGDTLGVVMQSDIETYPSDDNTKVLSSPGVKTAVSRGKSDVEASMESSSKNVIISGTLERTPFAMEAHPVGSYFLQITSVVSYGRMEGFALYRAVVDIAKYDTFVYSGVGQNCEQVTLGGELTNTRESLAAEFGSFPNYAVGAYCIRGGILYRCTTEHTGEWDSSHFTAVSVGDDIVNYLPTLFAPAGFGWGAYDALRLHKSTAYPPLTQPVTTLNTFLPTGFYYYTGADTIPADGPTGLVYGAVLVLSLSTERTIQFVMPWNQSSDTFKIWVRRGRMTSGGASFEAWTQIFPTT